MLFKNDEASLRLEIVNYEFGPGEGAPDSDDRNWLVVRGTYTAEDGTVVRDSNSCLMTYELRELAAGLKVLKAGIRDGYEGDFVEPYIELAARADGEDFEVSAAFTMPNTMEDIDTAEIDCRMSAGELGALIDELDQLCAKYPDRK